MEEKGRDENGGVVAAVALKHRRSRLLTMTMQNKMEARSMAAK